MKSFAKALDYGHELTHAQLSTILEKYCMAEGFTDHDAEDLGRLFNRFDIDGSGELEVCELGAVIRYLGYEPSYYRVYDFVEELGLGEDSTLGFVQFKAAVRTYRTRVLQGARASFVDERTGRTDKSLGLDSVEDVLRSIGYEFDKGDKHVQRLLRGLVPAGMKITFSELKQLEYKYRCYRRDCLEQNGGLTPQELTRHRMHFGLMAVNHHMTQKAVRETLAKMFPISLSSDLHLHKRIQKIVVESDLDGNGRFNEDEYIVLMQKLTEEIDRLVLVKGLGLRKKLGFSSFELRQFRDLFWETDVDGSGEVDFDELKHIMSNLVTMNQRAEYSLLEYYNKVDDNNSGSLDFWQFLVLMKKLHDDGWCDTYR